MDYWFPAPLSLTISPTGLVGRGRGMWGKQNSGWTQLNNGMESNACRSTAWINRTHNAMFQGLQMWKDTDTEWSLLASVNLRVEVCPGWKRQPPGGIGTEWCLCFFYTCVFQFFHIWILLANRLLQPKSKFMRTVFYFFCLINRPQRPPPQSCLLWLLWVTFCSIVGRGTWLTEHSPAPWCANWRAGKPRVRSEKKFVVFEKRRRRKDFLFWKETELKGAEEVSEVLSYNWPRILD